MHEIDDICYRSEVTALKHYYESNGLITNESIEESLQEYRGSYVQVTSVKEGSVVVDLVIYSFAISVIGKALSATAIKAWQKSDYGMRLEKLITDGLNQLGHHRKNVGKTVDLQFKATGRIRDVEIEQSVEMMNAENNEIRTRITITLVQKSEDDGH